MGKITGFIKYKREVPATKAVNIRIKNYNEFYISLSKAKIEKQAARCMDCGVPFCHSACPLGNNIPDFNDFVYKENLEEAYKILISTNNFPEFTGRVCPAPCEDACVLSINKEPTTIKNIEKMIIETAFKEGFVYAEKPASLSGKRVAVVGSGPSGLAAAAELNLAGHAVTVFERDDHIGGLLRYGIPDFKLEKHIIERRVKIMQESGIVFKTNTNVGKDYLTKDLLINFDAIVLCGGSTIPRDIPIKGHEAEGVHFAVDFLKQQNKRNSGIKFNTKEITAKAKNVYVIGGGDTGADCVGTSIRQGAKSVTQIEIMPKPPEKLNPQTPWPEWRQILRTSTSHQEGCTRKWSLLTKEFIYDEQKLLKALRLVEVDWSKPQAKEPFIEIEGSETVVNCDLAIIAIGFLGPQKQGLLEELEVNFDNRTNVAAQNYRTNIPKIFTAGDMHSGQSLVVKAIHEGREAALAVDEFLTGNSYLESKHSSMIKV